MVISGLDQERQVIRILLTTLAAVAALAQPKPELMWPGGAPNAIGGEDADQPALTAYLAPKDKAVPTAVVVCPGGGYRNLAMDHEGRQIAEWLNGYGISAFVLKYRLGPRYRYPNQLLDVRRAVRMVRARAAQYGIAPDRIGVWGFSAGGHLTSMAGTQFEAAKPDAADPLDRPSSRPDFLVLCYPVISLKDPVAHKGSRQNLLGDAPDAAAVEAQSSETRVTAQTPPAFLFHTTDDQAVPVENALLFYGALRRHGVATEMHIYEHGRHGVGLAQTDPILSTWPRHLADWLRAHGWLNR